MRMQDMACHKCTVMSIVLLGDLGYADARRGVSQMHVCKQRVLNGSDVNKQVLNGSGRFRPRETPDFGRGRLADSLVSLRGRQSRSVAVVKVSL